MKDIIFKVEHNIALNPSVFELKLKADEELPAIHCGQFLHLKINDNSLVLRRPFCICKFDKYSVTLVIAKVGKGTEILSNVKAGESVSAIVPIGNGFTLLKAHKKIALVGGGVGAAPLLSVIESYPDKEYKAYLGFSSEKFKILDNDFKAKCNTVVATDDGSYGEKGFITQIFKDSLKSFRPDVILTCGPEPMLKALAKISVEEKIPAYMSGESKMACGVGACLVCACAVKGADGIAHNMRACVDGPVFSLEDIIL